MPAITSILDTRIAWLTDLAAYGRPDPLTPSERQRVDTLMASRATASDPRAVDAEIIVILAPHAD